VQVGGEGGRDADSKHGKALTLQCKRGGGGTEGSSCGRALRQTRTSCLDGRRAELQGRTLAGCDDGQRPTHDCPDDLTLPSLPPHCRVVCCRLACAYLGASRPSPPPLSFPRPHCCCICRVSGLPHTPASPPRIPAHRLCPLDAVPRPPQSRLPVSINRTPRDS